MLCRLAILAALLPLAANAERLDAIAVSIGKHIITIGEITDYIRMSAFLDGVEPDLSVANQRKAAGQLVDQYLILEDAALTQASLPGEAALATVMDPLKARYPDAAAWNQALQKAGILELDLRKHLLTGLRLLRYTDSRFRPEVRITEENLRTFYEQVIARGSQSSQTLPSFEDSRQQVEQLLTGQLATQAMDRWLEMTRSETSVIYREAAFQ